MQQSLAEMRWSADVQPHPALLHMLNNLSFYNFVIKCFCYLFDLDFFVSEVVLGVHHFYFHFHFWFHFLSLSFQEENAHELTINKQHRVIFLRVVSELVCAQCRRLKLESVWLPKIIRAPRWLPGVSRPTEYKVHPRSTQVYALRHTYFAFLLYLRWMTLSTQMIPLHTFILFLQLNCFCPWQKWDKWENNK